MQEVEHLGRYNDYRGEKVVKAKTYKLMTFSCQLLSWLRLEAVFDVQQLVVEVLYRG